ncbi:ABC transporter permease [Leucobacter tenebrionis]|uniref:ABC transporter permease n=1 Tax=Leucobacter tenebrionis TaxID=2873270 RepID=UPI001CA65373|nr:ABC transporter permease [Leucobacter tenebrionis]QZY51713.1 ABC transporter permease [Leucobacter tenebrionis]
MTAPRTEFVQLAPARRRRAYLRDPLALTGTVLVACVLAIALFGPFVAPYGIDESAGAPFAPPGGGSLLGTDFMGQDVLSRLLHGGASVVWTSLSAAAIGVVFGAIVGMIAGFRRGVFDEVLMRLSDVVLSLPTIVFVLLFVSGLGRSLWLLTLLIGISHIPQVARVVRGATVEVAGREFVEQAQALGASWVRILSVQIAPNIMSTIMVEFGIRIVWSIVAMASLSMIGQGIAPPAADWGLMVNENRTGLTIQPVAVLAPVALIAVYALGTNLLAEAFSRRVAMKEGA